MNSFLGRVVNQGFALKTRSTKKFFSQKTKSYLTSKFLQGEKTGKKFDPKDISDKMHMEVTETGQPLFSINELVMWQQVASFWRQQYSMMCKNAVSMCKILNITFYSIIR